MVEYELATVSRQVTVIKRQTCDNCDKELTQIHMPSDTDPHPDDVLEIQLDGGYGQFIDGAVRVTFCKACATTLLEVFPLFS